MKHLIFSLTLLLAGSFAMAQEPPVKKSKVVKATEKINQQTQKATEASNEVVNQSQQAANNVKQVVSNAKTVISIFEPILRFRLKKNRAAADTDIAVQSDPVTTTDPAVAAPPTPPYDDPAVYVTQADITQGTPVVAEGPAYNTDGTANLGSQNNKKFGCYIDVAQGSVMDEVDAAGNARSIDLIFTATNAFNEQVPMYAFLTPSYVKNDAAAYNFFKGTKYKDRNIPPAEWDEVNESEVAMTSLTGQQFEKVQNNNQLMAVVKQVKGFGQKVESRVKLDGKVIAVKTEMGDRTAYGLIYIMNHYGTTGDNGYLKIRIKVTGFDQNGDGIPDGAAYQNIP